MDHGILIRSFHCSHVTRRWQLYESCDLWKWRCPFFNPYPFILPNIRPIVSPCREARRLPTRGQNAKVCLKYLDMRTGCRWACGSHPARKCPALYSLYVMLVVVPCRSSFWWGTRTTLNGTQILHRIFDGMYRFQSVLRWRICASFLLTFAPGLRIGD